jgi:Cytochrome C assembly protein
VRDLSSRLPVVAGACAVLFTTALALVFFYAPTDANQGLSQRIFYFHVPLAFTAYACFGWGAWKALRHLWKQDPDADLESYVAIHQGVIFGALTLATGSIWAKISWGVWWSWGEDQLVLFLVLFLFYCAYFMLRFSVEPGLQRANMSAVYALFGVVSRDPPLEELHPPGGVHVARLPDDQCAVPHLLCLPGRDAEPVRDALLDRARRQAPRCVAPRAPRAACMTPSEKYTAAAYLVVFVAVLAYVVIIASKLQRLQREVARLVELEREKQGG